MFWIPIKDATKDNFPEDATFDVWQEFRDINTGEVRGRRITNCWYYDNRFLHAELGHIRSVTHYMTEPAPPNMSRYPQKKP